MASRDDSCHFFFYLQWVQEFHHTKNNDPPSDLNGLQLDAELGFNYFFVDKCRAVQYYKDFPPIISYLELFSLLKNAKFKTFYLKNGFLLIKYVKR